MKIYIALLTALAVFNLTACSTASEERDEAQAEYTEEKTKTLQEYKDCVKVAEGDEAKMAQCESLLKAVEAVEGSTPADSK